MTTDPGKPDRRDFVKIATAAAAAGGAALASGMASAAEAEVVKAITDLAQLLRG